MPYKVYRLTPTEREYLETGEAPGSYRAHEMRRRIQEKVELLPVRFRVLQSDLELLEESGYIEGDVANVEYLLDSSIERLNR